MTLTTERLKWLHDAATELSATKLKMTMRPDELLVLTSELLANREAQPVAWSYEWASCITCEGPQNFQPVIEREAPPQWAIDEGQARSVTPLYTAPPAPAVMDKPRLPPHVYRDLLDMLQEAAIAYGGTQQLRAQLSSALSIHVQPDHPHTRAAILAQPVSSGYKLPGGWMACSDRMPDADGAYWCWFGKEDPSVIQQRVCIWNDRNHEWCDSAVTHWMPLPAAPEGGNG